MVWQVISSIASAVAALAAFITAIIMAYQSRLMRQSICVDVLLRLDAHFNSPDMKAVRRKAASFLLQRFQSHVLLPDDEHKCCVALDDLLDFFEGIAFLSLRKGTPDPESVWCFFFGYITCMQQRNTFNKRKRMTQCSGKNLFAFMTNSFLLSESIIGKAMNLPTKTNFAASLKMRQN